jgi:hypothetical protein
MVVVNWFSLTSVVDPNPKKKLEISGFEKKEFGTTTLPVD